MQHILKTNRLNVRTINENDYQYFLELSQNKDIMKFFPNILSDEEVKSFIDNIIKHQNKFGYSLYALELIETNEFIGFTGLYHTTFVEHFTPAVEIGWRVLKKHWGMGYAPEAAKAILDFGFKKIGLKEIVSFTPKVNKNSIRVMEKIGLKRNPSDDFNNPKVPRDSYLCPHVLYRLSQEDYFKLKQHK